MSQLVVGLSPWDAEAAQGSVARAWPRGGRQWLPVSARIPYRFLVTYRAPAERLRELVPAPLELDTREGLGFVSVCALRLERLAPLGWPRALAFDTPEFLIRVAVRYRGEPSFFTWRSWVASRQLAWLASRFSHYRPTWARFEEAERDGLLRLRAEDVSGDVAELEVESAGERELPWPETSSFTDALDAERFLLGVSGSVDVTSAGRVRFQPIVHPPWRARPARVHHARFDFVERLGLGARLDHALGMTELEQRWEVARPW